MVAVYLVMGLLPFNNIQQPSPLYYQSITILTTCFIITCFLIPRRPLVLLCLTLLFLFNNNFIRLDMNHLANYSLWMILLPVAVHPARMFQLLKFLRWTFPFLLCYQLFLVRFHPAAIPAYILFILPYLPYKRWIKWYLHRFEPK